MRIPAARSCVASKDSCENVVIVYDQKHLDIKGADNRSHKICLRVNETWSVTKHYKTEKISRWFSNTRIPYFIEGQPTFFFLFFCTILLFAHQTQLNKGCTIRYSLINFYTYCESVYYIAFLQSFIIHFMLLELILDIFVEVKLQSLYLVFLPRAKKLLSIKYKWIPFLQLFNHLQTFVSQKFYEFVIINCISSCLGFF